MLLDEIAHYDPRRESPPAAQALVQETSARTQVLGPSTSRIPRALKKPKAASAQQSRYYYPSPSTPSSIALTRATPAPIHIPSDANVSPVQSPSSSSSNRELLKSQQRSTVPLINPSDPSPSSPTPPASALTFSPVPPRIPPPIPRIRTRLSGPPDERVQNATRFSSPERPRPAPTSMRPLRNPLPSSGTPTVKIPSEPRETRMNPPFVPRYSNVKNKRWALWSESCYLLVVLASALLNVAPRSVVSAPRAGKPDPYSTNEAYFP